MMVRQPRERAASRRNREQVIADLRERAAAQVRAIVTGEDWAAWLRVAARFPAWSFTNVMLVAAQRPAATFLASYEEWQGKGRRVRKGEPGIQVIAEPGPEFADGSRSKVAYRATRAPREQVARAPRLVYVWDISQTSGLPDPDLAASPIADGGGAPPGLWAALTWLARREGFAVERAACVAGDSETRWSAHRIRVSPELDPSAAAQVLLHELGHVLAHARLGHLPGVSTAGCRGIQKIEADTIACIVATRLGVNASIYAWPYVASWAGSDLRARPEETVRAAGELIIQAAGVIATHLDVAMFGVPGQRAPGVRRHVLGIAGAPDERAIPVRRPVTDSTPPVAVLSRMLLDAERFYRAHLGDSWIPGYLAARGLDPATVKQWRIGYAPTGWTTLTSHLRHLGYGDAAIEAAGLARRSSRGTLIDHFRDRVMFVVHDERGRIAGFIGRAHPDAGADVPKYLNSPETVLYTKGNVLFGLHEAREQLAHSAMPVIVEGPFDAIAVSTAGAGSYVGLAPCGTALTARQLTALAGVADLDQTGVLVALDGDRAGRDGIVKAYEILLIHTDKLTAAILPNGRDPAGILQTDGPAALRDTLRHTEPLAQVVIDAHLDRWGRQLGHPAGQLAAMRSAAGLIAGTLPPATVEAIRRITGGRSLALLDENLLPVVVRELPEIAGQLPAGAICQIVRVATRTGCEHSEVTAEVANVVTQMPRSQSSPPHAVSRKVTARSPPRHLRVQATGSL
jgi:DNA primase catalytic core